jgi:hypothetical protein
MSEGLDFSSMLRDEEMERNEINAAFEHDRRRTNAAWLKTAGEHLAEAERLLGHLKEAKQYLERVMANL